MTKSRKKFDAAFKSNLRRCARMRSGTGCIRTRFMPGRSRFSTMRRACSPDRFGIRADNHAFGAERLDLPIKPVSRRPGFETNIQPSVSARSLDRQRAVLDVAEKPDFSRPPPFRDRECVLLLGDVESHEHFAILSHGPPSVHEARLEVWIASSLRSSQWGHFGLRHRAATSVPSRRTPLASPRLAPPSTRPAQPGPICSPAPSHPSSPRLSPRGRNRLESVREHHVGLHSFRNMKRMEARRRKASAL